MTAASGLNTNKNLWYRTCLEEYVLKSTPTIQIDILYSVVCIRIKISNFTYVYPSHDTFQSTAYNKRIQKARVQTQHLLTVPRLTPATTLMKNTKTILLYIKKPEASCTV
jgi:hypothetical protein